MPASSPGSTAAAPPPRLPDRIGNYRILGRLGEGGMGVVFEAEQQSPRRRVALKVIRDGGFADELSRRLFAREIATLARLRHAHIAQIYESGITDDGHPFFTMELLHGVTLGQHVRGRSATPDAAEIRARVRLFGMVCDAISHAHQRGVIHRDLKPANIVVLQDSATASAFARGTNLQVKVLDFGLARLEQDDPTATSIAGAAGSVRGTLPYMSPEQVRGEPLDVRTDVYSLGVILYELIAGRRPYEVPSASLLTAARVICETPPRPLREGWPGRGKPDADLETILRKALEKDCDRRYGSVAALAEDLERWLAKQPILARPPSAAYQMRKFIARHRVPVALGSALLVSLFGFGIGMSVLYARSLRAEKKAVAEAETARRVGDYLVGLFRQSDPREKRGVEMTTEELLSRGAVRVDRDLADRPDLRAQVMTVLADVHLAAGLPARAESLALVAATAADSLGADSEEKLEAQSLLMHCAVATGRLEDARRLGLDLVERARRIHGPEHERTLLAELNLAMIQWDLGRMEEAFPRLDRANAWVRGRGGARTPFELEALQAYAAGLFGMGRVDESAAVMGAVVTDARRLLDPNDHRLSGFLKNYGITLQSLGRPSEGAGPLREAYGIDTAIYPRAHLTRADSGVHFAWVLNELGRAAEAETVVREAVASLQAVKPEYWRTGMARVILGESLARQGRLDEAEPHILEGWAILEADAGSLPPFRRAMLERVVWFHDARGRAEDAERARARYRREYGADPPALPAL